MTDMIMHAMAPMAPATPSVRAPGRTADRGHEPGDRSPADLVSNPRAARADGPRDGSGTDPVRGERDFLTVLAALLPGAAAGKGSEEPQDAQQAIAEALTELARLGEGDGEPAVGWPMPAMLARFIDPSAPTEGARTLVPADTVVDEARTGGAAELMVPAAATAAAAEAVTVGTAAPALDPATAEETELVAALAATRTPADAGSVDGEGADAEAVAPAARGAGRGAEHPGDHGRATAAAARAEAAARIEEMSAVAAARPTDTGDEAADARVATTSTSTAAATTGTVDGLDGLDGLRIAGAPSTTAAEQEVARAVPGRSFTSSAASVQRVLDAVELLENAPPPRQLTLELGDNRLRVSLEDGQVRLSLLGQDDADATRLVDDARAALQERGFDLGGDRPGDGAGHDDPDRHEPAAGGTVRRPASRSAAAGLQL